MSFKFIELSSELILNKEIKDDNINVIYQFYIPNDSERYKEIKECLLHNVNNEFINNIYLLNEKEYSIQELGGIHSDKIKQVVINKRLTFSETFNLINEHNISGYNVIINSDIFLDNTINNIKYSDIKNKKICLTQLRHNYESGRPLNTARLFGPRFDSQDAWIMHSNFNIPKSECYLFNFLFGTPGCDNKLVYLFKILGYHIVNDPLTIKIYHLHKEMFRNYNLKPIEPPWGMISAAKISITKHISTLGIDVRTAYNHTNGYRSFSFTNDNIILGKYIFNKLSRNENFIIPRIGGIENNYALIGNNINCVTRKNIKDYLNKTLKVMKKNAGIQLINTNSIRAYSQLYLDAFKNCDIYTGWEPWGDVYSGIKNSHNEIRKTFPDKKIIWAFSLDIFHYIRSMPWTFTLKGKRILIISPFADSMREKDNIREKMYGVDLFPECSITYIKPPQTQGDEPSQVFIHELESFYVKLDAISNSYDVALVSAGGYGNLICNHIYITGHSAIYIGGVLQMYFGIFGERWLRERSDILRLYLNEHWTRPKHEEKPINYENVENSCYW